MNKTLIQIYDDYLIELNKTLISECNGARTFRGNPIERDVVKLHKLETLIALYWELIWEKADKSDEAEPEPYIFSPN